MGRPIRRQERSDQRHRTQLGAEQQLLRVRSRREQLRLPGDLPKHRPRPVSTDAELLPLDHGGVLIMTSKLRIRTLRAVAAALAALVGGAACSDFFTVPNTNQ